MGQFVTVSAFRVGDTAKVKDAAMSFFAARSWPAELVAAGEPVVAEDVLIYAPVSGWTVIVWPGYFTELAAVEFMSRELNALASTVRIHDGDYWSHTLLRDGDTLDRFATMPDYFTDEPAEVERLRAKYAGRPAVVAETTGSPMADVAPYLVQADPVDESSAGKAFVDDEFDLDDPWVFVDFWRRLGPRYPDDISAHQARIRPAADWVNKLSGGDAEL
ncbi:hypothetical protein Q0Z83_022570 [Actinoplanes sichuanensis]|uniref:Uncharacterized protein n=1 Tax=Actinoplanes sichuanensis TaxID=512349 RepID=A0ABW4AI34_9ACTN|nr:hypothetical protein [Actinoplanes sichuanensis]BEL04066.1 hypothetical protein Q0Z83_022570 [Actinoplanes sichuanensis]